MAKFRVALGAEIDAVTSDEMSNGLDVLRGDMRKAFAKPRKIMRPLSQATSVLPGTGGETVTLVIGRPAAGRIWVVTRVTVLGDDDNTTAANLVAAVYVGDDSNPGLTQCVLHGQAIPFTSTQNEHAWVVHDRETLFIQVTATADIVAAEQIVANALAWEYRDSDIDSQVI